MKVTKLVALTFFAILATTLSLTAQSNGGLKKSKKQGTEVKKDSAPIKVKKSTSGMTEEDKEDVAKAKANANKTQMNDTFKKKKSKIDKANAKVAQMKAKFKAKLQSGDWSQEKFDRMMDKIAIKENKIIQKKNELVNSLMKQ